MVSVPAVEVPAVVPTRPATATVAAASRNILVVRKRVPIMRSPLSSPGAGSGPGPLFEVDNVVKEHRITVTTLSTADEGRLGAAATDDARRGRRCRRERQDRLSRRQRRGCRPRRRGRPRPCRHRHARLPARSPRPVPPPARHRQCDDRVRPVRRLQPVLLGDLSGPRRRRLGTGLRRRGWQLRRHTRPWQRPS